MIAISGYQFGDLIHESANSLIYQGHRQTDNQSVILKVLKSPYPSPEQIVRLKREYEIISNLELRGVVKALALEKNQQQWVMVLEDFGGQSLAQLKLAGQLSLSNFLTLAIRITEIIGQIHQRHIIHKDINPSNIVIAPFDAETEIINSRTQWPVKLIDFGISTVLSQENHTFESAGVLQGTLVYISPEQTGRMNRTVDYRTDFYSLGITFYELLTGQLPFYSDDSLEIVHSHIAKQPTPPHEIQPDIPQTVSNIILKLIAKNAEDRYQSSFGLKVDLEEALHQWLALNRINDFSLGQQDISDKLQISQTLYGCQPQLEALLDTFAKVQQGASRLMLITGRAGIGKTVLVQELYKPVTPQQGYFITCKFDKLQHDSPYAPIIEAFRSLVQQLLTESEDQLAIWKEKLLTAFGSNGQIITKVIPEIESIVGAQPQPAAVAGPLEAQNRFNLTFQHFIKVFAQPEHPLIIFLDDLHWANETPLELIKLLITAPDSSYLFLIGAYQESKVTETHPLRTTLNSIERMGVRLHYQNLIPLTLPDVTQFVVDTLHCWPEEATPLAELVLEKTGGNPYFMGEFLKSMYAEKLIKFDSRRGTWQWDAAKIRIQEITDNVVGLMAEKVQKLPPETQYLLKLAACIGHQFDLDILAIIAQQPSDEVAGHLWPAISEGLILLLRRDYEFTVTDWEGEVTAEYKFAHDRVQQAVYSLISEENKQSTHWQVGQLLKEHTPENKREERIFDLVNQLNLGRIAALEPAQWDELAQLNLQAGQKAKLSTTYQPALNYFKTGIELLKGEHLSTPQDNVATNFWKRQHTLTITLYTEAVESAYLVTDFTQMNELAQVVLANVDTLLDKTKTYEVIMLAYIAQNQLHDVISTALSVLKQFAVRFPINPTEGDVSLTLQNTEAVLAGRRIESLISLPEMTDPYRLATIRILSIVSSVASIIHSQLLPLLVFKMVNLSIKYGNSPESALAYADYGLILCGRMGDIETGTKFGQLALDLLHRLKAPERKARTLFSVNAFIMHWQQHVRDSLPALLTAYESALEFGDLEYAARSIYIYNVHSYFAGRELSELEQEVTLYSESIAQLKQKRLFYSNELYRQAILNLRGKTDTPYLLNIQPQREKNDLAPNAEASAQTTTFNIYLNKLILYYLFEKYPLAVENGLTAHKYLESVAARLYVPVYHFYDSLAHLALLSETMAENTRPETLKRVTANQTKLKKWAKYAPMNHLHKYYLVEAELAYLEGQHGKAREFYDQAIALAHQYQYINEVALANELAAKFYFAKDQIEIANVYLQKAHYTYIRWGAMAKVKDLEKRHPQLTAQKLSSRISTTSTVPMSPSIHSTADLLGPLDLTSVIKGSQILSGEIMLPSLLSKMMSLVIENAGAQKGYLLLKEGKDWSIEATGSANDDDVSVIQAIPLEIAAYGRRPIVPPAIINYVLRSQENVVLNDVTNEGQYTQDPYIIAAQPKSILCMPLITQGKLIGILYLENNLITGAFTPNRLEILKLLSGQAAISIENARYFTHQMELTRAYSRFVPREVLYFLKKTSITQVSLGDQIQQEMTVLFSDIRSFTNLSEQMTPQENFNFINAYLRRLSPIIREYNGFIDKYMGDAIMALFPTQADDAVKAAVAMQQEVTAYNISRKEAGYQSIKIGIGLHTGMVMLGTIGEAQRMEATVISDAVNLAARLEGLTKLYSSAIIISGEMMFSLESPTHYNYRFLDKVKVKGKEEPVSIFEILDSDPDEMKAIKLETQSSFEQGVLHYHSQEFTQAKDYFSQTLALNPTDAVAQLYLHRVQHFIDYGVPLDWEGVTVLTEK